MHLANIKNPFVIHKLDDTVSLPPGDVPELHADVLAQCRDLLDQTREAKTSTGMLIVGEAGSGKSHLIAQFRKHVALLPNAVLAAIRLSGANAGCLWRHLRERLVIELLQRYASTVYGENGLLRILRNTFPKWSSSDSGSTVLDVLFGKPDAVASLRQQLEDFAKVCPAFDGKLRKVLPLLVKSELTSLAHDWLRGEQLVDDDLKRLGLPPEYPTDLEQERIARAVVLSLLRLAGERTIIFLCFDEVEAIQAGNFDAAVLRQFATIATELLAETGARVIATSIRPKLQIDLSKAVEVANMQKLAQFVARIPALTWEQTVRIARCRMDAEPTCANARKQSSQDPDWPLGGSFLQKTFADNRLILTPRHLIVASRVEFEQLQKGIPTEVKTGQSKTEAAGQSNGDSHSIEPIDDLMRMWEKKRKKYMEKPQSIQFDNVIAISLPWLVDLSELSLVRVQDCDHRLGDVNLIFQPNGKKAFGVSMCNHEPRVLWRRLDRILNQWTTTKGTALASLTILRAESARDTDTAKEKFATLEKAGVRVIRLENQQLAELTAFQVMLTATLEGEMIRNGKPLESNEYDQWANANLSEAVKAFLHQIFKIDPVKAPPIKALLGKAPVKKKRAVAPK